MNIGKIVHSENLSKTYPNGTRALDGISFGLDEGVFFGFLGPNGAGKSTLMKILSTLIRKTAGTATVAGFDVEHEPGEVRKNIGFAMQEVGLDDLATGINFLTLQGVLYGMSNRQARSRAGELLDIVGLQAVADKRVGTYSGGMRRRIDLAGALMHRPRLLFLDEPTTGLDPQSRIAIWDYLKVLNGEGVTVFMSTQLMDEADRLCESVAVIDHGRIVAQGSPASLKAEVGVDMVRITVDETTAADAAAALRNLTAVRSVDEDGNTVSVSVTDGNAAAPELMRTLHESAIAAHALEITSPSLDDVFLMHTGRSIRDDETRGDGLDNTWRPWLGVNRK